MEIDESIQELVDTMNQLPGVRTFTSCGGHREITNGSQRKHGAFYVAFEVTPNKRGFLSLAKIAAAVGTFLPHEATLIAWYNCEDISDGVEIDGLMFEIEGQDPTHKNKMTTATRDGLVKVLKSLITSPNHPAD